MFLLNNQKQEISILRFKSFFMSVLIWIKGLWHEDCFIKTIDNSILFILLGDTHYE